MIKITDEHIKNGKLDRKTLAKFGADVVRFEGDKIIFKSDVEFCECDNLTSVEGATFSGNAEFWKCNNLSSVDGVNFNGDVEFCECYNLTSVYGANFKGMVLFAWCDSLVSVSDATFNQGFKAINCPKLNLSF